MSKPINHVIQLKQQRYIVRLAHQKVVLLSYPQLHLLHKHYTNASYASLNSSTNEILLLNQNEVSILKAVVSPLQLVCQQQSFVDWHPVGGIIMQQHIVLFGTHGIVFYTRSNIMEKTWQIEVFQDIEELKCNSSELSLAMKVKEVQTTMFLWKLNQPSAKPAQEITFTHPIRQFQFTNSDTLMILTSAELRVYVQTQGEFNLYHFFLVQANSLSFLPSPPQKLSVNSMLLLSEGGEATLLSLYGLEKRLLKSESREVGRLKLECERVSMRRVISVWNENEGVGMVCEGRNSELFVFQLDRQLKVTRSKSYERDMGAEVEEVYVHNALAVVKEKNSWKYYKVGSRCELLLLEEVDCQKAFVWSEHKLVYLYEQALFIKEVGGDRSQPIPFKYSCKDKVHALHSTSDVYFFVSGIRFYRLEKGVVSLAGFALKNERAELVSVDVFTGALTYLLGQQFVLFSYRIVGQKVVVTTLKSSSKQLIAIKGGRWLQKQQLELAIGEGDRVLAVFSLFRLLKILDSENKIYEYAVFSLQEGVALLMKNYVFFLQLVQQERGCQIVLIKRANSLLYHRFNPHCTPIRLLEHATLIFRVGNTLQRIDSRLNRHSIADPYTAPETLLRRQLELKKCYPPHHPRLLQLLIQTGKVTVAFELIDKVRAWLKQRQSLQKLYESVTITCLVDALWREREEDMSRWPQQATRQSSQTLSKFCQQILQNIEALRLKEKTPFLLQSLVRSFARFLANNKSVDYFSQAVLINAKGGLSKGKGFSSMEVAFLAHSLNKEEAAAELKPEKASWEWLREYSVPLWFEGKEQLKKWVEQIGVQEYRQTKDPLNCLLWYLLVGKRALLATLFKNHKLDSKEHQAIADFLVRDFSQAKDRSAAVKNAYVLIDKKRYFHALSFFILGAAIDDCIRLAVDRLKDINLAYLFLLLFKEGSPTYLTEVMLAGDQWMKHIAHRQAGRHILSYNCLFEENSTGVWGYSPELTGFHPALLDFAFRIRNSVAVRREVEAQKEGEKQSEDIFADFYGQSAQTGQTSQQPTVQLSGDIDQLKPKSVSYYLAEGVPALALALQESNEEAKQAYYLELYQMGGVVSGEVEGVVKRLCDDLATFDCLLLNRKYESAVSFLAEMMDSLRESMEELQLAQVLPMKKHLVGQILHFAHSAQQILQSYHSTQEKHPEQALKAIMQRLQRYYSVSKAVCCLALECYEQLLESIEQLGQPQHASSDAPFWQRLKLSYDSLIQAKKTKSLQQMDHFEHVFVSSYRPNQSPNVYRPELELTQEEAVRSVLALCVLKYLAGTEPSLAQLLLQKVATIQGLLDYWLAPFRKMDLLLQLKTLLKEGTQSKLKLAVVSKVFDSSFNQIYDIVALTHGNYFQCFTGAVVQEKNNKELQAVEVYRNRTEGLKAFALNLHCTSGLQCVVLLRKSLKKFEVCANLVRRDRSKDGFSLLAEESGSVQAWSEQWQGKSRHPVAVQETLEHILQLNKGRTDLWGRKKEKQSEKEELRRGELPAADSSQFPNCLDSHPFLPLLLTANKTQIQVASFASLATTHTIKCTGMADIVKLHSSGQRVGTVDSVGSLALYHLDMGQRNNCVYSLKKSGVVDFCYLTPSVLGVVSGNAVQAFDTLLHPKRQTIMKQSLTKQAVAVCRISESRMAVLRKADLLIYDLRMKRVDGSKDLKIKSKCLLAHSNSLYLGQTDARVRVLSLSDMSDLCDTIKLPNADEREREKVSVEMLANYESMVMALSSQGSIYCLPRTN